MKMYQTPGSFTVDDINEQLAWVLGFFAADGSIPQPARDKPFISFCINVKDVDVLFKIRHILNIENPVREYHNNQDKDIAVLTIYGEAIVNCFTQLNMKQTIPDIFMDANLNRHYLRGLFDGDGCIHIRERKGKGVMAVFINAKENIVRDFAYAISKFIGLPFKQPKFIEADNLFRIQYEAREARLLTWYLYHGNINDYTLSRKHAIYKSYSGDTDTVNELFNCFFGVRFNGTPEPKNDGLVIPLSLGKHVDSLIACKQLQQCAKMFDVGVVPIFKNKGQYKYYMPYIPNKHARYINMLRPYIVG